MSDLTNTGGSQAGDPPANQQPTSAEDWARQERAEAIARGEATAEPTAEQQDFAADPAQRQADAGAADPPAGERRSEQAPDQPGQ